MLKKAYSSTSVSIRQGAAWFHGRILHGILNSSCKSAEMQADALSQLVTLSSKVNTITNSIAWAIATKVNVCSQTLGFH